MEFFYILFLSSWTWEVSLRLFNAQSQSLSIDTLLTTRSEIQVKDENTVSG